MEIQQIEEIIKIFKIRIRVLIIKAEPQVLTEVSNQKAPTKNTAL
jgi:hypothetical protein